ncbi:uncharacterized protein PG986_010199 [Apiospora aurea]|uniref:Uncharacterized protein n=1 Tax=Apiospora aurea TaxID=335848 RepID=A0ABR1Q9Y9_9PEZI
MAFETKLPCSRCAPFRTKDIKSWLENLEGRGDDDDDKRVLVAELAYVVAYLEENPNLHDAEENLARMSGEVHRLGEPGVELARAVQEVCKSSSASHMAFMRGMRYWHLRHRYTDMRTGYLDQFREELGNLAGVRADLEEQLHAGEVQRGFGLTGLISLQQLNSLYYALADVYEAIAQIAVALAMTHWDLYPWYQPYVTSQRFLQVRKDLREKCDNYKTLPKKMLRDVGALRGSLPVREVIDHVPIPSREDFKIEWIKMLDKYVTAIVLETRGAPKRSQRSRGALSYGVQELRLVAL